MSPEYHVAVVGGGAAGVFAAIACAEAFPPASVLVLEKSAQFLSKVLISGGGRCNVTHACSDPRKLAQFYPRGSQALIGPFHRFQPADTQAWFERRGVRLKTEADGRMFPASDSSRDIADCLLRAARSHGVRLVSGQDVTNVSRSKDGRFLLTGTGGGEVVCKKLMLATGGCRAASAAKLAVSLGHSLIPPVPSLFAFQLGEAWLKGLAGVSVEQAGVSIPEIGQRQSGALLITHGGISGPAVLRASAWGARELHQLGYNFTARINWLPSLLEPQAGAALDALRTQHPAKRVCNTALNPVPIRLWQALVLRAGVPEQTRWADLSAAQRHNLLLQLRACDIRVLAKSLNKEEFVTCGGIPTNEVHFKTMESRICPGLFFGGELLDIDGVTGGFNFQAAWTTGWIAGNSMAKA